MLILLDINVTKRKSPERQREILTATLKVLRAHGVSLTSTAKIAAEANCSKETIYNWFGDRQGLFTALVEEQTKVMLGVMKRAVEGASGTEDKLIGFCAALIDLLTGEANVLIGRAVIGELGSGYELPFVALDKRHEVIRRLGAGLLEQAKLDHLMMFDNADDAYSTLFGLVICDRQIRTFMGAADGRPSGKEMILVAKAAVSRMRLIYKCQDCS